MTSKQQIIYNDLQHIPKRYLSQANFYVECILQSHLLLEEDMEIILNEFDWHFNDERIKNDGKGKTYFAATALSTACGISQAMTSNKSYILMSLSFFPLLATTLMLAHDKYTDMRFKKAIKRLVENLRRLHKLNKSLQDYLETREFVRITSNADPFLSLSPNFKNILQDIFAKEISLADALLDQIEKLSEILMPDTVIAESWKVCNLHLENFQNYEECFENFKKLRDICTLVTSKFLGSLAVSFTPKLWKTKFAIYTVLDTLTPQSSATVCKSVDAIENAFNRLRFSIDNINLHRKLRSTPDRIKTAAKIAQPLTKFLTHLQLTFELAQHVHEQLLKCNDQEHLEKLSECVITLREELTACDRTLDSFSKMYAIIIKRAIQKPDAISISEHIAKTDEKKANVQTIRYDDEFEPEDEEYDVYIGASDEEELSCTVANVEDQQSTAYLSLMLEELKESLKERQALRAARLGLTQEKVERIKPDDQKEPCQSSSKSDTKTNNNTPSISALSPPRPPLISTQKSEQNITNTSDDATCKQATANPPLLPPPPPVLPKFDLGGLKEGEFCQNTLKTPSLLANAVKLAASQRSAQEEVFGDSFEDSDGSEDTL